MFTVLYSFKVKEEQHQSFEKYWLEATQMFREFAGGLGSRLHKQDKLVYIAYAQWPDRKTWLKASDTLPDKALNILRLMRATCEKVETLYEMEVVHDLLVKADENT